MKTKEELNTLKEEIEALNKKLAELSEDEMEQVTGGVVKSPKIFSPLLRLNNPELDLERGSKNYAKDLLD